MPRKRVGIDIHRPALTLVFERSRSREYEDIRELSAMKWADLPTEIQNESQDGRNHPYSFAADGSVYGAVEVGDRGWADSKCAMVMRWDAGGRLLWKRALATGKFSDPISLYKPGQTLHSTFRNNVGVVYGNLVAQDDNGGHGFYDGQAFTYVWDRDGLWVGGLFDTIDTRKVGKRWYNLSSDNGAGAAHEDADGSVLYFGGTENATHVDRIRGWNDFARADGQVKTPIAAQAAAQKILRRRPTTTASAFVRDPTLSQQEMR